MVSEAACSCWAQSACDKRLTVLGRDLTSTDSVLGAGPRYTRAACSQRAGLWKRREG